MARITGIAVLFSTVIAVPLAAQPAPRAPTMVSGGWAAPTLDRVERALRMRERIELTDEQARRLETLRGEEVERLARQQRARLDIESRARAGLLEGRALRTALESQSDEERVADRAARDRFEEVLSEEQRQRLGVGAFFGVTTTGTWRGPGASTFWRQDLPVRRWYWQDGRWKLEGVGGRFRWDGPAALPRAPAAPAPPDPPAPPRLRRESVR